MVMFVFGIFALFAIQCRKLTLKPFTAVGYYPLMFAFFLPFRPNYSYQGSFRALNGQ